MSLEKTTAPSAVSKRKANAGEYRLVFHQYCRYSYVLIPIDFEWLHFRVQVVFCVGSDVRQFDVSDFHHICE